MVEFFFAFKNGKSIPFMYMLPEGLNVYKVNDVLDFGPLKDYVGDLIKVVYLESEDPDIYEHGNASVEVGIITKVNDDGVFWE